jgi:hypothetical protein
MQKFVILSLTEATEAIAQYLASKGDPATVSSLDFLTDGTGIRLVCGLEGFKPDDHALEELEALELHQGASNPSPLTTMELPIQHQDS